MKVSARQGGFTPIDWAVLVTILAILAAFAIPRFVSLETQARTASRDALAGSVRSGAALAHALWLANGGTVTSVTMQGEVIEMVNGYPDVATIDNTLVDVAGYSYTVAGVTGTFANTSFATCTVTYKEAPANGAPPTITVDAGSC
jgi:MSHA pilin protein MshA